MQMGCKYEWQVKARNVTDKQGPPQEFDILFANSVYPEPVSIFVNQLSSLDKTKDTSVVVLDTNALLVPYAISSKSLDQLRQMYSGLAEQGRLVVPAQVAREFAKHRANKLADLYQQLSDRKSKCPTKSQGKYPLLDGFPDYNAAIELEGQIDALVKKYQLALGKVMHLIRSWSWNDPVSLLYSDLFDQNVVLDHDLEDAKIKADLSWRFTHHIPPGYKDATKDDDGIGDLLIWHTILALGRKRKCDVLFVSGEEKADWCHRSMGQPLYPRYELVDEYRRYSSGRSFHFLNFSTFIALYGLGGEVLDEARQEEIEGATFTSAHRATNEHIRTRALNLVSEMRDFLQQRRAEDDTRMLTQQTEMRNASSEEERSAIWDRYTQPMIQASTAFMFEYSRRFKVQAIVLRDELLSRVLRPSPKHQRTSLYEHPTNPLGVEEVADDLEWLARSLP
jgi:hypothetical protein